MWFKHRAWIPTAWILSGLNIAGAWFAAGDAEPLHAATHALLAVLFAVGAQRLQARAERTDASDASTVERLEDLETRLPHFPNLPAALPPLTDLEQRLDLTH